MPENAAAAVLGGVAVAGGTVGGTVAVVAVADDGVDAVVVVELGSEVMECATGSERGATDFVAE